MKKMISVITSAIITFYILSVFLSPDVHVAHSANGSNVLKAGYMGPTTFEGITVELEGDTIKFIAELNFWCIVITDKGVSPCKAENAYSFRLENNSKYAVIFEYDVPVPSPPNETFWFGPTVFYAYEIEVKDNTVFINKMFRMSEWDFEQQHEKEQFIEIFSNSGNFVYEEPISLLLSLRMIVFSLLNQNSLNYMYEIYKDSSDKRLDSISICSDDSKAEIWCDHALYIRNENSALQYADYYPMLINTDDIQAIVTLKNPHEALPGYGEPPNDTMKIMKREGEKLISYTIDYVDYNVMPSTLKVTECPENDVNADGSFNIADIVQLQTFLLGSSFSRVSNWRAADLNEDGALDVFDLVLLRKALIAASA